MRPADVVAGGLESPAGVFAGRRPVLLDARMDASMVPTDVGDFGVLNVPLLMNPSGQTPC